MDQNLAAGATAEAGGIGQYLLLLTVAWLLFAAGQAAGSLLDQAWLWPADVVLVGVLVRYRMAAKPLLCWLAVGVGLVLANLSWGSSWVSAVSNGTTKGLSMWVAWRVLWGTQHLDTLRNPQAIKRVLLAGLAAALVGSMAAWVLNFQLSGAWLVSYDSINQFLGQWLAYCAVLPVILLLPKIWRDRRPGWRFRQGIRSVAKRGALLRPVGMLAVGFVLYYTLQGPGAVAFLIPGLMYAVFVYPLSTTARLVLLVVLLVLFGAQPMGAVLHQNGSVGWGGDWHLVSLQIGLLMVVSVSLLQSSIFAARNDLIAALTEALDHDDLTKALSRRAFVRGAQEYLQQLPASMNGNGLLILDIDHFKVLNDTHGHVAGDTALREFSRVVQAALRPEDLFGRLGGEEFGVALPNTAVEDALMVAERLRVAVESIRLYYDSVEPLQISVSIGVVHTSQAPSAELGTLIEKADEALYLAKRSGRNQVYLYGG